MKNKIVTKFLFIGLSFITFSSLYSQQEEEITSSLLWEVKGKKVKSPTYIMGTMHLIAKDKFYFPDHLKEKVANADLLIMEIGGISEQMKMAQKMFLQEGNLFDHFTDEQADTVFSFLEENFDYSREDAKKRFGRMKPIALMQLFTREAFGEGPASYEMTLEKIAKENEVEIDGLETIEEQMKIFDEMSMSDQVEMVLAGIRDKDASVQQTEDLQNLYLSQDIEAIYQFMQSDTTSSLMNYEDNLLTNRNKNWIPLIKKHIKKKKCFIAVGAAHLGGENGVINLLREEGYEVTPVKL
jgi:uncharacterized protein YbaP (TraB family)